MNAEQTKLAKRIRVLVKMMSSNMDRQSDSNLAPSDVEAWKGTDELKEYRKLTRRMNSVWKDELAVSSQGGSFTDYRGLLKALHSKGISHYLPKGFTGEIDAAGKWWIKIGPEHYQIDGVPSGYLFPKIEMNDKYDPETSPWVFRAVRHDGSIGNYFYTRNFKQRQRKSKFETVADLIGRIDDMRVLWLDDIKNFHQQSAAKVAAVILELLYQFSARVGSVGNGTEEGLKTFGISTLRVKHVKINGSVVFRYYGKDGVKTKHTLSPDTRSDMQVIKAIKDLMVGKKPSDYLFTYTTKGGKKKPVRANVVNDLFRELGAGDATVHKLRTYHATVLARDLIAEFKTKRKTFRNAKDCHAALVKIAEKVGKKLNHVRRTKEGVKVTGATALQNYIDVLLQKEFFDHYGVEYPKSLLRMIG